MNYTQFANQKVRISSTDTPLYEGCVWGFQFDDEINENVLEVWTDEYIFQVGEIRSIEVCPE